MNSVEDTALQGKVAVITGAGRGIGRAIALAYAKAGAAVVCSARSRGEIDETITLITAQGGRAIAISSDVANYESVEALFSGAVKAFDGVDIVLANAGVGTVTGTVEHSDPKLWKEVIDVNLVGAFNTARAAIPHLRRRGAGKLILMGSGLRQRPNANMAAQKRACGCLRKPSRWSSWTPTSVSTS
jgi:3-oxoacyl-[acyl-carrier protein] reductase